MRPGLWKGGAIMEAMLPYIITALVAAVVGALLSLLGWRYYSMRALGSADRRARQILAEAKRDAEKARQEAAVKNKTELLAQREQMEGEIRNERNELKQVEKRLTKREDNLDRKVELLDNKEQQLASMQEQIEEREQGLKEREKEFVSALEVQEEKLQQISRMTREEARREVLRRTEEEMEQEVAELVERSTQRAKELADINAQRLISIAINRLSVDYTTEHVVSTVELSGDEMKGRIIGREGRNIRAFEGLTGIDVIVDDTPGVVVLSGFEPVRREIAVRSMSKLVADGRIHPARIEEVVNKTTGEIEKVLEETGKAVAVELDVRNLKPREIMLLGRLKFRTSYGQNVLDHSREVGFISGMLAAELGLDETLARRCGLLHDIGKAVDHEEEGTHPELGGEVARRCSEPDEVIDAITSHHSTETPESIYSTIVQAADAISAARPGARRETLEKYIKRLERLEAIATSYPNVEKAFAIQAGRELRVIAKANKVSDGEATHMCRQVAKQIEDELSYPGEVKVTLIRELRITEYAR